MYSPKIDKHTPNLYRLSKVVGKPMTKVADDLLTFSFNCLKAVYTDLNEKDIPQIIQKVERESDAKANQNT